MQWDKDSTTGKFDVKKTFGTVGEAINKFQSLLILYFSKLIILYTDNNHTIFWKFKKHPINNDEIVLQVDFAEIFSIQYQDEIQAAHFRCNKWQYLQRALGRKIKCGQLLKISNDLIVMTNTVSSRTSYYKKNCNIFWRLYFSI